MRQANPKGLSSTLGLIAVLLLKLLLATSARAGTAPDKLIGVNSSRVNAINGVIQNNTRARGNPKPYANLTGPRGRWSGLFQ